MNVGGLITTGGLGNYDNTAGGTFNITGTVTNTATTFDMTGKGNVTLAGGSIIGGTVKQSAATSSVLEVSGLSGNTLNNVKLLGDLNMPGSGFLRVTSGLVLRNETDTGNGVANITGGSLAFTNTQTFDNATINMVGPNVTVEGNSTLTLGAGAVIQGHGGLATTQLVTGGAETLLNQGIIRGNTALQTLTVGNTSSMTLNNQGTIEAINGALVNVNAGTIANFGTGPLVGGIWRAAGSGSTLTVRSEPINTSNAEIILDGVGSVWRTQHPTTAVFTSIESSLTTNLGTLRVLGNRNWTSANLLSNTGTLQLGGGTFDVGQLTNGASGTIRGFGTFADEVFTNAGLVRAEGGTLNVRQINGPGGTVQVGAAATLNLSSATTQSRANLLSMETGASLNLGTNHFIVANDYTNANFGTGNAFNARSNVSGTGEIRTSVAQAQTIAKVGGDGTLVGGTTATPSINFGNVRIGESKTIDFNVGNTSAGATAALHGAFKTTGLTPGLFTGSAGGAGSNWDAAAGGSSGTANLTFTAATAGALSGQTLQVVNNFANVAQQTISIGANGYALANPTFGTLDFGSVTAGTTKTINLVVNNFGTIGDAFQEGLNASWGTLTNSGLGTVTTLGGPITNLAAGLSNGTTLQLQLVAGTTAGAVAGNVQVLLQSNGTGTSGLGNLDLTPQLLAFGGSISGVVTNLAAGSASPTSINFGNKRLGDVVTAPALTITNTAAAPAEGLNASFGTPSNAGILASGTVSNVAAGDSNTTSMTVGMSTASVGNKSGTVAVNFTSNVSGGSPVSVGSQTINVTGSVFRVGTGSAAPTTVNLGNFRVGGAAPAAQNIAITNSAADDGFSEKVGLNGFTPTGAFNVTNTLGSTLVGAGDAPVNAFSVALGAGATAGVNNGNLAIQYSSDGAGTSGLSAIASNNQNVALTATGFNAAAANTLTDVTFTNRRVGTAASQALSISNTAPGGAFTEKLNASFGTTTGSATTAGGPINLLSPEASPNTSMSVGINTATRGAKTGTVQVNFATDGTGTSGLPSASLASQTINVSGNVYAAANPTITNAGTVLNFGNVLRNTPTSQALGITNTGTLGDMFQEDLSAIFGTVTGTGAAKYTTAGSITNLVAGDSRSTMTVSVDTSATGTFTAVVPVNFTSTGTVGGATITGLGTLALPTQNLNATITVTVGDTAIAGLDPTTKNFGKFREGAANQTQVLTVSNLLAGPGEGLNATFGANTGTATNNGVSIANLAPGASNNSMSVTLGGMATAGAKSGTVAVNFESDGTFNGGVKTPLASQTVNLSAEVYRLGVGSAIPSTVNLGNFRLGGAAPAAQTVQVANTATNDAFSESVGIQSITPTGAFNVTNTLGSTRIAVGAPATNALNVALGAGAVAGINNGNVQVQYLSDGAGTSGLGTIASNSQTVLLQATGFNAASANTLSNVVFANRREGTAASQALSISNTAPTGSFTEKLNASFGTVTGTGVTTAGGPISLLSPEASPNTSMSVGLNTATAGAKSGTVQVNFETDGTGTSGLAKAALASQVINVSGNVYRLGVGSAAPTTVDLGNFRLGGPAPAAQNVQVSNTAANDGFSESVGIQSITPTGAFNVTNTLGATRVAAGAPAVNALNVALGAGAVAGVNAGNVAVQYLSDGAGTSGLGTIASNSQNVALSATGYNAAAANTLGNVVFANRHVGTAASQALSISNTAPTGSFTEKLNASFGTVTGTGVTTAGGPINLLSPEASPNTSMSVGINVATAGAKSGTVQVNFATDGTGTSGLPSAALASQTINVSGNVYALASAAIENAGTVLNFGSVLRNSLQTRTLAITNVGTLGDAFQEGLDASFGTVTGTGAAKFATAGSISNLAAGDKNNTAMTVTLNTADTGVFSASVPVIFVSNGTLSGLTNTALGTTNLAAAATVTLTVGDLAIAGLDPTTRNFGKFREGAADQTQQLTITNLLGGPGEGLNATFGANTGTATNNGGSVASLAPGGSNNTAMSVTLGGLATAGAKSGSVAVNFESDGTFNGGVKTTLPSQTVNLSAEVYRLAQASVTPDVTLAARRVGDAAASASVSIANTAATDGFSEGLKGTIGAAPAPFGVTGPADTGLIAAGGSVNRTVSLSTATAGNFSGNLAIGLVSNGEGTSDFGDAALPGANVVLSGKVYEAAKANLSQNAINFGLRRVGDAVAAVAIDVTNGASGALTDSLKASGGPAAPGPFTASGPASGALTTTGLAGGATQAGAYAFGMNTGSAGSFSGNATFGLISTNPDMADLALTGTVALEGVVNNYARIGIAKQSGGGAASSTTSSFTIDFGTVAQGTDVAAALLRVFNDIDAALPGDDLKLRFDRTTAGSPFTVGSFFDVFVELDPGVSLASLLSADLETTALGSYEETFTIEAYSINGVLSDAALAAFNVILRGTVIDGTVSPVPVPATWTLLGLGAAALWRARRKRAA